MDASAEYLKRSPLTYAAAVNTPVLLLHGEADLRCPISQSEEYFLVFKATGQGSGVRPVPRLLPPFP